MSEGDVESLLRLYDPEAVFLDQSREVKHGREGLRQQLAPSAAKKARFDFKIKQVILQGAMLQPLRNRQLVAGAVSVMPMVYEDVGWRWPG